MMLIMLLGGGGGLEYTPPHLCKMRGNNRGVRIIGVVVVWVWEGGGGLEYYVIMF